MEIVSAILGISYPFIYQLIVCIDDKCHSINLVRLFRKGVAFRIFNVLLILLLFLTILMSCITKVSGSKDHPGFEGVSIQRVAMILIGVTLFAVILLIIEIGR